MPFSRGLSQTAIWDQPHLATCHLRGGGARGLPPHARPTMMVGRPYNLSVRPKSWSEGCYVGPHVIYMGMGMS